MAQQEGVAIAIRDREPMSAVLGGVQHLLEVRENLVRKDNDIIAVPAASKSTILSPPSPRSKSNLSAPLPPVKMSFP